MNEIILSITITGRKYGYITWRKKDDPEVRALLGKTENINLDVGDKKSTRKRIDWKRRRIGITYTITRNLSTNVTSYVLSKSKRGGFRLFFT